MKTMIVGMGEVGTSLKNVLEKAHEVYTFDLENDDQIVFQPNIDILNICFPYNDKFEEHVRAYQEFFNPCLTIIHSTVPVGTSRKLGAVHSPIHGKHPNLKQGILTFYKFIGAEKIEDAERASRFLKMAGIWTKIVDSPETSEISKIYCTTQYGLNIVIMKEIKQMCDKYGANFDQAYKLWNEHYNDGYEELGMEQFRRYVLDHVEGKIGGHCVIPNAELLKDESPVARFILEQNERY